MQKVQMLPQLPARQPGQHKGDFGRALIIAGSRGMAGAAALAGEAALRAGAGLVTVATTESVYPILAAKVTCCTTHPLPETAAGTVSHRALNEIREIAADFNVLAIGPGLGRDEGTWRLVRELVAGIEQPMVVDADGLNALSGATVALKRAKGARILTPHPGEMARLLSGITTADIQHARAETAARFAEIYRVVLVLKGHDTVVSDGEQLYTNTTGNPGMATGGAGDVLTGVIAGLAAQGLSPFDAAVLGVHVHGLAGDLAAAALGETSLIASDLLDALPTAFTALA